MRVERGLRDISKNVSRGFVDVDKKIAALTNATQDTVDHNDIKALQISIGKISKQTAAIAAASKKSGYKPSFSRGAGDDISDAEDKNDPAYIKRQTYASRYGRVMRKKSARVAKKWISAGFETEEEVAARKSKRTPTGIDQGTTTANKDTPSGSGVSGTDVALGATGAAAAAKALKAAQAAKALKGVAGVAGGVASGASVVGTGIESFNDWQGANKDLKDNKITKKDAAGKKGGAIGKTVGAIGGMLAVRGAAMAAGAASGAAIGTLTGIPVVGTIGGALVGAAVGYYGSELGAEIGGAAGNMIGTAMSSDKGDSRPESTYRDRISKDKVDGIARANGNPATSPSVEKAIEVAAAEFKISKSEMMEVAAQESSMNPDARNKKSKAVGLYQFIPKTWDSLIDQNPDFAKKYSIGKSSQTGNDDRTNAQKSAMMYGLLRSSNLKSMGGASTGNQKIDVYLAHLLGSGRAKAVIIASKEKPNSLVTEHVDNDQYSANLPLMSKDGRPCTVKEFIDNIERKLALRSSQSKKTTSSQTPSVSPSSPQTPQSPSANHGATGTWSDESSSSSGGTTTNATADVSKAPVSDGENQYETANNTYGTTRDNGSTAPQSPSANHGATGTWSDESSNKDSEGVKADSADNKATSKFSGDIQSVTKVSSGVDLDGLQPDFKARFGAMAAEYLEKTGKKMQINSGFRSREKQAELFKKLGPGRAAPPGKSNHEKGRAIDINSADGNKAESLGLLTKHGFVRPIASEKWHVEMKGGPKGSGDNVGGKPVAVVDKSGSGVSPESGKATPAASIAKLSTEEAKISRTTSSTTAEPTTPSDTAPVVNNNTYVQGGGNGGNGEKRQSGVPLDTRNPNAIYNAQKMLEVARMK